jgi:hypothetical protein
MMRHAPLAERRFREGGLVEAPDIDVRTCGRRHRR